MDGLELCQVYLMSLILSTAEKYINEINLVSTTPRFTAFSAISVIDEIDVDMSVFPTSKNLCSWAGIAPQNVQSAGKRKPLVSAALAFTSNRFWFNSLWPRLKQK